jgi:hypothetical protein
MPAEQRGRVIHIMSGQQVRLEERDTVMEGGSLRGMTRAG